MSNFKKDNLETRYLNDALFHNLVAAMQNMIEVHGVTPSEMREALFYAHYRYEMYNVSPIVMTQDMYDSIAKIHRLEE